MTRGGCWKFLTFGARRKDNAKENVVRETKGLGKLRGRGLAVFVALKSGGF